MYVKATYIKLMHTITIRLVSLKTFLARRMKSFSFAIIGRLTLVMLTPVIFLIIHNVNDREVCGISKGLASVCKDFS
ncbi:hypothetical protein MHYMCMPSP_01246 [Hyalomma marginatum]|uniref:Uncharacterized protein n=1 Tax=Hyalomma marginatum TaxID=34627 RepID=A0A8S4BVG4_9ACAR|nr:hypothetical protein MHYMCMPASI_00764 [Hyalomma marginatum]CAG7599939.1 hypothetical protein MHYMCMPSP_01246 [Hyalomma marginatum]